MPGLDRLKIAVIGGPAVAWLPPMLSTTAQREPSSSTCQEEWKDLPSCYPFVRAPVPLKTEAVISMTANSSSLKLQKERSGLPSTTKFNQRIPGFIHFFLL